MSRAPLYLVLLVTLAYANGLGGAPLYDDWALMIDSPRIVEAGVWQAFTTDFWGVNPGFWRHTVYRPLATLAYSAIWGMFGFTPFAFHAASLIFHAAATLALFYLVRALGCTDRIALIAAAIFGVHPLNVEAVSWMSSLAEVICGAFVLTSMTLYLRGRTRLSLAAALIAMLTKEAALALPALIFLIAQAPVRKRCWDALPYAALSLGAVTLRSLILPPIPHARMIGEIVNSLPVLTGALAHYLCVFFVPYPLGIHYDTPSQTVRLAAAGIALLWIVLMWRWPKLRLPAGLALIPLGIPLVHSTLMALMLQMPDRNVYLSVAGVSLTLALLLERLPRFTAPVVLAILLTLTLRQVQVWRDPETFWANTLKVAPASKEASAAFGEYLFMQKRFQESADVCRAGLDFHPNNYSLLRHCLQIANQHAKTTSSIGR